MTSPFKKSLRTLLAVSLFIAVSVGSWAQGVAGRSFINGEAIITVAAGTPRADVDAIAAGAKATVVYAFGTIDFNRTIEAYHLRATAPLTTADTQTFVSNIKASGKVLEATPNKVYSVTQSSTPTATPNDPRFNEQWDKTYMKMPQAWTLEKGNSSVVLVVIDTGLDITHPEFQGRLLPGYDSNAMTADPTDKNKANGSYGHGTHVMGIAAAQADNSTGVAGVVWQNVKLLPIAATDTTGTFPSASLIRAYQYVLAQQTANTGLKYVVNLSLGGADTLVPSTTDPGNIALLAVAKAGGVIACGAGNGFESGNPPFNPANLAQSSNNILCVTASNHLGGHSYFSQSQPYTTIAAPGGDFKAGKLILSTWPTDSGSYMLEQGTSMASPQIAGVAALLLSVQGVNPANVRDVITSTAQAPAGGGITDKNMFGAGIVDAYAALSKVAIGVTIVSPSGTGGKVSGTVSAPDPVETLRPEVRVTVGNITSDNFTVSVDNFNIPAFTSAGQSGAYYTVENVTQTTNNLAGVAIPSRFDAVIRNLNVAPGQHHVDTSGTKVGPPDIVVTDTRNFIVQPHVLAQGRSMVSFPYYEFVSSPNGSNGVSPEMVIGTDFKFARWLPDQGRYAFYTSIGLKDPLGGFTPGDTIVTADGGGLSYDPLGLGFFADFGSAKPVLTHGIPVTTKTLLIPLKGNGSGSNAFISWNLIGDPFASDVPFAACLVDVGGARISIQEAVNRGLILPNIYSYDPATGYTFRSLPDGTLKAWSGHWVGVTSSQDIKLVVPPAFTTRSVKIDGRAGLPSGTTWALRLGASSKGLHDSNNVIGVGGRAAEGYDLTDVPKPPLVGPYVGLAIEHKDWGKQSGVYAQDIRSAANQHTWNVVVNTDQPNSDVTVSWAAEQLPRNVKVSIKDDVTGQIYDMRTRSGLTFNSGTDAATRRFTISSRPASQDAVHVSNVVVRPSGRGSSVSAINFTLSADASVDVKVVSSSGALVSNVATRANQTGDVKLVWLGKDNAGRNVAAGTYLVQIKATGTAGDSVSVVYPFAIVR